MADEFDHFRTVCHNALDHSNGKRFRIRLRIVDGQLDVEQAEAHTAESLGQFHRLCVWAASVIEPSNAEERVRQSVGTDIAWIDAVEIVRLDDKSVAVPSSDGVAMPIRLYFALWRKRTAIRVDRAEPVIRLGDVENLSWCLDNLKWLRIDVILKWTLRQAQSIRIVQAILCRALLLELGRPWLERQSIFESGACVAAPHQWRPAGWWAVRLRIVKSNPDAGQVRLAVGCSRRRCLEVRLAVRAFRNSRYRV